MYTSKTLALAALAALSLGVGSAMAQDGRVQSNGYWAQSQGTTAPASPTVTHESTQVQSGSSDMRGNPDADHMMTISGSGDGGA
jgi:hypothetical protein